MTCIIGDYYITKKLGRGSTGSVRLGIHKTSGQRVAIKIIPRKQLRSSIQQLKAVERELAILQLLHHPHLIELYQVLQDNENIYFVTEYVSGGELFFLLKKQSKVPEVEARAIFVQIVNALAWCHSHHICHRDLKPENILMDKERKNVKIADFGMATMQPKDKLLKTDCGSICYASPEIVRGIHYYGPATDVWSAGVILYVLLVGKLPFHDVNQCNVLNKIKSGRFKKIPDALSSSAKNLLKRLLQVDPTRRITMKEVLAHPWMQDYSYCHLDPLLDHTLIPPVASADIDGTTWETLKILWRDLSSENLIHALSQQGPNTQKLTFHLLLKRTIRRHSTDSTDSMATDETSRTVVYHHTFLCTLKTEPMATLSCPDVSLLFKAPCKVPLRSLLRKQTTTSWMSFFYHLFYSLKRSKKDKELECKLLLI
ncbi:kinase-like protein [Backusella circina FSU 941]|nr:kinase-like protein [Backusella circina FSU 941]